MDSWGELCRFVSVDFTRRARNTRGRQLSASALSGADTSLSDVSCGATLGTLAGMILSQSQKTVFSTHT